MLGKKGNPKQTKFWQFCCYTPKNQKTHDALAEIKAILDDIDESIPKFKSSTALKQIFSHLEKEFTSEKHIITKHNKTKNHWQCTIRIPAPELEIDLVLAVIQDKHKKKSIQLAYQKACTILSNNQHWREFFVMTMLDDVRHPRDLITLICPLYNINKSLFDPNIVGIIGEFFLPEGINPPISQISLSDHVIEILQKKPDNEHQYKFSNPVDRLPINSKNFTHQL